MKLRIFACTAGMFTAAIIGCATGEEPKAAKPPTLSSKAADEGKDVPMPKADGESPKVSPEDLKAVVDGNNEFAFDLYGRLAKQEGNLVISPYSLSVALAMTHAGARGDTAKEIADVLRFALAKDRLDSAFGALINQTLQLGNDQGAKLSVANGLWVEREKFSLDPGFLRNLKLNYSADCQLVEFSQNAEQVRKTINTWVEDKTENKITDLFPAGGINAKTRLALVNAVYFKADWATPFFKSDTKPEDFTVAGLPAFKTLMMNQSLVADYIEKTDFQLAAFGFRGNQVRMIVVLPKNKAGLRDIEKALSASQLSESLAKASPARLQVAMPRFKVTQAFDLVNDLGALGVRKAFQQDAANFAGMGASTTSERPLFLSVVYHKAYVDFNEEGVEAAAATGVGAAIPVTSPAPPIYFRMDRPFLFLIRHETTGKILFMGRIADPRS